MSYTENRKFGNYAKRFEFRKDSCQVALPNLIDIQSEPYQAFVTKGIQSIFDVFFPIIRPSDGEITLEIQDWRLEEPQISIRKTRSLMKSYEQKLHVDLKLTTNLFGILVETDENVVDQQKAIQTYLESHVKLKLKSLEKEQKDNYYVFVNSNPRSKNIHIQTTVVKSSYEGYLIDIIITVEETTFFCKIPKMTPQGTFIINGHEKVIVLQMVRSPGVYFKSEYITKKDYDKKYLEIIPSRGAWLKFETDQKKNQEIAFLRINKSNKITITNLLSAFGLSPEEVDNLFDNNLIMKNSYEKDYLVNDFAADRKIAISEIYQKIKVGEVTTQENAFRFICGLFFDSKKYDLSPAGRYKINTTCNVLDGVFRQHIAQDIFDENGDIFIPKKTFIIGEDYEKMKTALKKGFCNQKLNLVHKAFEPEDLIFEKVRIYKDRFNLDDSITTPIIGISPSKKTGRTLAINDLIAAINVFLHLNNGIVRNDDIDDLGNKIIKTNRVLLEENFRMGNLRIEKIIKEKMSSKDVMEMRPLNLINSKPLDSIINEFFNVSPVCQFLNETNPLAKLSNQRRITTLGPGGLTRERASLEARDVHFSHFGRICPVETPEGQNIGLITNLCLYARLNKFNFIETPYLKVINGKVQSEYRYFSAHEESKFNVAPPDIKLDNNNCIIEEQLSARHRGENVVVRKNDVDYIGISPKQILSVASSLIPLAEKNDANRDLMGAVMARQAVPVLESESPIVGTGMEYYAAHDTGLGLLAAEEGKVTYVDGKKIIIENNNKKERTYLLENFAKGNQNTLLTQIPLVKIGDKVKEGQFLADGPAMENGELALGRNCLIAFTTYEGYNFEDAVIISERLIKDDVFTSLHMTSFVTEVREKTKLGKEEITNSIPNVAEKDLAHLDEDGIVRIGTEVHAGDILIGKITPKSQVYLSPTDKLLNAIFGDKSKKFRDASLRLPNGVTGIVQNIIRFKSVDFDMPVGVTERVVVLIMCSRKIEIGDKITGRHGNKGVISIILPEEDMPHLEDGTPVDILLNPLGVPSRMNVGQVWEIHLGYAAKKLGIKISIPVFESPSNDEIDDFMKAAGVPLSGKELLIDGRTGETIKRKIAVGVMYIFKLNHMVEDKMHARSTDSYSLVTQQPLSGKAQKGGQRFGEMERWALKAYGAAYNLRELFTYKSDNIIGRSLAYNAIVHNRVFPEPWIPESFKVLMHEIKGLGFNMSLLDENGVEIKTSILDKAPCYQTRPESFLKINTDKVLENIKPDLIEEEVLYEKTMPSDSVETDFNKQTIEEDIIATSNVSDFEIEEMFDKHFAELEQELINSDDSECEAIIDEELKVEDQMNQELNQNDDDNSNTDQE